jgi:hypothetical protein
MEMNDAKLSHQNQASIWWSGASILRASSLGTILGETAEFGWEKFVVPH